MTETGLVYLKQVAFVGKSCLKSEILHFESKGCILCSLAQRSFLYGSEALDLSFLIECKTEGLESDISHS